MLSDMNKSLERFLNCKVRVLPTTGHYAELLSLACTKFGIEREEARKRYGLYTYAEWKELLEL